MEKLLDQIGSPDDLKALRKDQLPLLAAEIREEIIKTVSRKGGHLASNLGVVELTIALHYVFNSPTDKLVWDVGHQTYTHKLLTGRRRRFKTLRQFRGLSGFLKRQESLHDCFDSGHSSTSISAALGMSVAQSLKGDKQRVVAVIGDGSMTGGLAFEGLNQAGHLGEDLIVILNDNEMSISPNVGALASYLSRVMTGRFVNRFRSEMKAFLKTLPGIGSSMYKIAKQAEESFKGFLTPGVLFEELGFKYIGPIEGHRLDHLIETFSNIAKMEGPIVVHVLTKKGKGYYPAESDPARFHGIGPFHIETGRLHKRGDNPPTYTEVFGKTMVQLAEEDDRIIAITAAMEDGTGLRGYSTRFPKRFFDIGIAEQHAVTFAAGLALKGFKPVVAIYSTFLQRAYDQVQQDVCLQNLPVVFALDRGGIVGSDGPTHHGLFDFSYLRHLPNMVLMAPKDENEFQHMIKTAIGWRTPIAFRYPKGAGYGVKMDRDLRPLEVGKGEVLLEGEDVLILAIGSTVYPSLEAAHRLSKHGIGASVINCRFVKPLDGELLCTMAEKLGNVITVEENVLDGGFGSAVLELFGEKGLSWLKVKRIGIPDRFVEHGPQEILRGRYSINTEGIVEEAREMVLGVRGEGHGVKGFGKRIVLK
ncbi:MAG: 1-deoxy-D-xylulose-5-phosphate synthase [Syntrophobacterales bacterium]|nr:MAG: 1-deoxy-D-xylulose-5-phosphate synthase [Syntrophobacterales bacterium]